MLNCDPCYFLLGIRQISLISSSYSSAISVRLSSPKDEHFFLLNGYKHIIELQHKIQNKGITSNMSRPINGSCELFICSIKYSFDFNEPFDHSRLIFGVTSMFIVQPCPWLILHISTFLFYTSKIEYLFY